MPQRLHSLCHSLAFAALYRPGASRLMPRDVDRGDEWRVLAVHHADGAHPTFHPNSYGRPHVDDLRVPSGAIVINRNGLIR